MRAYSIWTLVSQLSVHSSFGIDSLVSEFMERFETDDKGGYSSQSEDRGCSRLESMPWELAS